MTRTDVANRNIRLYLFVRIFAKRVFLPVSAIYYVTVSGLNLAELGVVVGFYALVGLVMEVPSGFFADKFGRSNSIILAGLFNVVAILAIVLLQNRTGVFIGTFFESVGYAFLSGSGEALLHDSLEVKGKPNDYTKVASRAQSISLFVSVITIALIPMTYSIDARLPFLIGAVGFIGLAIVGYLMKDQKMHTSMKSTKDVQESAYKKYHKLIPFAFFFGLIGAAYIAPSKLENLALVEYGIAPALLGFIFALTNLVGALLGLVAVRFKTMGLRKFLVLDVVVLQVTFIGFWTGNMYLASLATITSFAFWRYRNITYQDYIFTKYPTKYKATLLSALNNVVQLQLLWMAFVASLIVLGVGYSAGFGIFVAVVAAISVPFYIFSIRALE